MPRRRKCGRCKKLGTEKLCSDCRSRCQRCNNVLPAPSNKKCVDCIKELSGLTKEQRNKDYNLVRTYGITFPEYDRIFAAQGGVCFICRKPPGNTRLAVDHKHAKQERRRPAREKRARVRGLLCWQCNKGLAVYRDNHEAMLRASVYLQDWPAQKIIGET